MLTMPNRLKNRTDRTPQTEISNPGSASAPIKTISTVLGQHRLLIGTAIGLYILGELTGTGRFLVPAVLVACLIHVGRLIYKLEAEE